ALASLADAPGREHAALVAAFGQAWAAGLPLRPETLDRRDRRARLRLPTYPFERKRYWVDVAAEQSQVAAAATHAAPAQDDAGADAASSSSVAPAQHAVDGIGRRLRAVLKDVTGLDFDSADPHANFFELGLDSLALTQVAQRIGSVFGATITFRQLMESCNTLVEVEAALHGTAAPAPVAAAGAMDAAPAQVAAAMSTGLAGDDAVASILDRQLQLMSQQLAALAAAGDDQGTLLEVLQQQQLLMSQQLSVAALVGPAGPELDPLPPAPGGGGRGPPRSPVDAAGGAAGAGGDVAAALIPECAPAASAADAVAIGASPARVPTTEPQREIWLASRIDPSVALAFNQSISLTLRGALDAPALDDALRTVVARHDALRSTISTD